MILAVGIWGLSEEDYRLQLEVEFGLNLEGNHYLMINRGG
jgi:hypothetical protein